MLFQLSEHSSPGERDRDRLGMGHRAGVDMVAGDIWSRDGRWWQGGMWCHRQDGVAGMGCCGREGTWCHARDGMSKMGHGGREGTWWQGGVRCHLWYKMSRMGPGGREGTGCHIKAGVAGMGRGGRSLAGRVTPWSGGPGVGRDLPGSVGCRQPPSRSPLSPRRCRPRGRVPALPGEWVPGPPGQPRSPVPRLPGHRGGGYQGPAQAPATPSQPGPGAYRFPARHGHTALGTGPQSQAGLWGLAPVQTTS